MNHFKNHRDDISIFSYLLKDIFGLLESFANFKIEWIVRASNSVVNCLCKLALNKRCTLSFNMEYPCDIYKFVVDDSS